MPPESEAEKLREEAEANGAPDPLQIADQEADQAERAVADAEAEAHQQ